MKIKLSRMQFFAIYDLLQQLITSSKPYGIEARLLHSVLIGVYKKFYTKAMDKNKKKYSVSLNDEEACAWYLFFTRLKLSDKMELETAVLLTINNNIHQKFAA